MVTQSSKKQKVLMLVCLRNILQTNLCQKLDTDDIPDVIETAALDTDGDNIADFANVGIQSEEGIDGNGIIGRYGVGSFQDSFARIVAGEPSLNNAKPVVRDQLCTGLQGSESIGLLALIVALNGGLSSMGLRQILFSKTQARLTGRRCLQVFVNGHLFPRTPMPEFRCK